MDLLIIRLRLYVISFTQTRAPWHTFTCSKSRIETPKKRMENMIKVNNKDTRTMFECLCCWLWAYFTPFPSVSIVEFEHVNIYWVPPYQFINAEITYCCSYLQTYTNRKEIAAHKKGLRSKVVAPKKNIFPL